MVAFASAMQPLVPIDDGMDVVDGVDPDMLHSLRGYSAVMVLVWLNSHRSVCHCETVAASNEAAVVSAAACAANIHCLVVCYDMVSNIYSSWIVAIDVASSCPITCQTADRNSMVLNWEMRTLVNSRHRCWPSVLPLKLQPISLMINPNARIGVGAGVGAVGADYDSSDYNFRLSYLMHSVMRLGQSNCPRQW